MRVYLFGGRLGGVAYGVSFRPTLFSPGRSAPAGTGFVYVMRRADGEVKVGSTRNPPQRLRNLQTGSSSSLSFAYIAAAKDPAAVEREAICLLNRFRLQGDWFEVSPEAAAAAVSAAAARLGQKLTIVDPVEAKRSVPAILGTAERRSALRNFLIVVVAIAAGIFAAWSAATFIDETNVGTPYNPGSVSGL